MKEKKKRKKLEYIQQVWDEMIVENTILLERTERFQIMRSKCKKVTSRDKKGNSLPKKLKRSKWRSTVGASQLRWGMLTPVRGM